MENPDKYSLLKKLGEGEEQYWDYVSDAVWRSEISRVSALSALEKCLKRAIPNYQSKISTFERAPDGSDGFGYWNAKINEALRAKKMIRDAQKGRNRTITYRGRSV